MLPTVDGGRPYPTDDFAVKIVAQAGDGHSERSAIWAFAGKLDSHLTGDHQRRSLSTKTQTRQIEFELTTVMRVLFLKTHNGVSRALRYALLALTLVIVLGYGVRVTLAVVLERLPSLVEMIGAALLLGLLVVFAVRWHHNRRMRRVSVDLQDSALW
jgi:hypothetical protein